MKTLSFTFLAAVALTLAASMGQAAEDFSLPGLEQESAGPSHDEVLKSAEWRKTMQSLESWFADQRMYDPQRVLKIKKQIVADVKPMSGSQMLDYMKELQQTLKILNGKEGRAARTWIREQLTLASDSYAVQLRSRIPDVFGMAPEDLVDLLQNFAVRVGAQKQATQEIQTARADQASFVRSELNRQQSERDRAMQEAIQSGGIGGGVVGAVNVPASEAPYGTGGGWGGWGGYGGW
jgi:hypothetical protein